MECPRLTYGATPGRLALTLTDKDGHPLSGVHFSGTVSRPATDREDRSANFHEVEGEEALCPRSFAHPFRAGNCGGARPGSRQKG
jgi:hypothetical protein